MTIAREPLLTREIVRPRELSSHVVIVPWEDSPLLNCRGNGVRLDWPRSIREMPLFLHLAEATHTRRLMPQPEHTDLPRMVRSSCRPDPRHTTACRGRARPSGTDREFGLDTGRMASVPNSDLVARILFNVSAVGFAISEVSIRARSAASRSGSKVDHGSIVAVLVAMIVWGVGSGLVRSPRPRRQDFIPGRHSRRWPGGDVAWYRVAAVGAVWTLGRLFTDCRAGGGESDRGRDRALPVGSASFLHGSPDDAVRRGEWPWTTGCRCSRWSPCQPSGWSSGSEWRSGNSWPAKATPTAGTPRSVSA